MNSVSLEFGKLMDEMKIEKAGVSTASAVASSQVASETGDQIGVDRVMGHVSPGMGEDYRHWLKDKAGRAAAENHRARSQVVVRDGSEGGIVTKHEALQCIANTIEGWIKNTAQERLRLDGRELIPASRSTMPFVPGGILAPEAAALAGQ